MYQNLYEPVCLRIRLPSDNARKVIEINWKHMSRQAEKNKAYFMKYNCPSLSNACQLVNEAIALLALLPPVLIFLAKQRNVYAYT
jgi:hypothetical protein